MAFPYLEVVISFIILVYMFETYLNVHQYRAHNVPMLPKPLVGVISQEKFEKSRAYSLDKSLLNFVREFVNIVLDCGILYFKVLPWVWKKSGELLKYATLNPENEIWHTLTFLGGVMIWLKITKLPFSLYATFVIEARHGFNKRTLWLFFKDELKGIALAILIGAPIVSGIILIVQKGDPHFAIDLWCFMFVISIEMVSIYPVLTAPLFNKFTPLPEGDLRMKMENLAASQKFPLKKLFVVDESTRSSHSNAYMYRFFNNKSIVLYDTLLQQCTSDDEIVAVLAHELGHWKLNHALYNSIITMQILMFLQLGGYTLIRHLKALFESFGFHDTQLVFVGLIIFQYALVPLDRLVTFAMKLMSRSFEFEADAYAKNLGYAKELRAGLIRLQEENLGTMNPDPLYSAYHYSHPPLVERLAALDK